MSKVIFLPRTPEEFDKLVDRVCKRFNLIERGHAAAVISVAIRHIDNNTATTTVEYLGHSVLKNIANQIANMKSQVIQHETQVLSLFDLLTNDPGNQQARDELEKAANEGSKAAKSALEKLQNQGAETASLAAAGATTH